MAFSPAQQIEIDKLQAAYQLKLDAYNLSLQKEAEYQQYFMLASSSITRFYKGYPAPYWLTQKQNQIGLTASAKAEADLALRILNDYKASADAINAQILANANAPAPQPIVPTYTPTTNTTTTAPTTTPATTDAKPASNNTRYIIIAGVVIAVIVLGYALYKKLF